MVARKILLFRDNTCLSFLFGFLISLFVSLLVVSCNDLMLSKLQLNLEFWRIRVLNLIVISGFQLNRIALVAPVDYWNIYEY